MTYKIAQDFSYRGGDYWDWQAWIDAAEAALDAIDRVVWILHPTFPQPRIESRDRPRRFKLTSAGWGTFDLYAELHLHSGTTVSLSHMLRLEYPLDTSAPEATEVRRPLKVYLSYGSEDAPRAAGLRRALEGQGISVQDATSISESSLPIEAAVRRSIRNSDAVVGVIGEETASPFLIDELEFARKSGRQVMMLNRRGNRKLFGMSPDLVSYGTSLELDTDQITAEHVLQALGKADG